ncbi:thiamine phosphate synthase [Clostridium argentinense]|nr:thiamine phosphate synthase [Clostridium argentinense]NFF39630.1 thiamine phosphate synthase [Clostridium argentinense]NFP51265.1 thiamine phosphate synthase [Clostridium argentinense]NFP72817.1 thiamine phosphate synthase [Clostridium argentinense]NFP77378.1 thiamine phosphate synthase [Clostridium argentinense]
MYAILGEDFSNGRDNIQLTKELIESGIKIIQYREKNKDKVYKLNQCKIIRELTKKNNVTFIVNDDIDIALAVKADGIHLGQEDMDSLEARKIAPNMIIGLSTHNKNQALLALEKKVDYIGVGPIFNTTTKKDVEYSEGLEYLKWVSKNIKLPSVTIGGIKEENLMDVISHGSKCFAMISELISTENIKAKVNNIRKIINGINEEDNYELHNSNGCC